MLRRSYAVAALALLTLIACTHVPSPQEAADSRSRELERAIAGAQASFGGVPFTPDQVGLEPRSPYEYDTPTDATDAATPAPTTPTRLDTRATGMADGDTLFRLADGALALEAPTCLEGGSCGCEIAIAYRYLRHADGRVAVVRLRPVVHLHTVKVDSCGYGCGQPPPPIPRTAAALGVTEPARIQIIEAPYRYELVRETCDHPIPRP